MVEQDSPEFEALQSQFDYLVSTISVSSILPKARAKLITPADYDDCIAERTDGRQAQRLLVCLEKAVKADPGKFYLFISILDKIGQSPIGDRLRNLLPPSASASTPLSTSDNSYMYSTDESRHRTVSQVYNNPDVKSLHALSPQLSQLVMACPSIASKWYILGYIIAADNRKSKHCLSSMFDAWLKSYPSASWSEQITALWTINKNKLAHDIAATYLPSNTSLIAAHDRKEHTTSGDFNKPRPMDVPLINETTTETGSDNRKLVNLEPQLRDRISKNHRFYLTIILVFICFIILYIIVYF